MTLSIGIITRFRHELLNKCLGSIAKQTLLPNKVIIVLHPQDQQSINLAKKYSKTINIKMYFYSKKGYATQRNLLLQHSKSDILYTVDDDCILDSQNVKNIIKFFTKNPQVSALQGKAVNIDTSFYSQFIQWTYNLWIKRLLLNKSSLYSIDTKNVAFNVRQKKKQFKFNECFGSEDVDFGLQLYHGDAQIKYSNQVAVWHHESANTLTQYFLKKIRMRRGINLIKHKWQNKKIHNFSQSDYHYLKNQFNNSPYSRRIAYRIIFTALLVLRKIH